MPGATERSLLADLPPPAFAGFRRKLLPAEARRRAQAVLEAGEAEIPGDGLEALAVAHSGTGEERYLGPLLERAGTAEPEDPASVLRLAYAARTAAAAGWVTDERFEELVGAAASAAGALADDPGIEACCARLAVAGYLSGTGAARSLGDTEGALRRALSREVGEDGAHTSGSPGRHLEVTVMLGAALDGAASPDPGLARTRMRMEEVLSWMLVQDGTLAELEETAYTVVGGPWAASAPPEALRDAYRHPALLHAATAGRMGQAPPGGLRVPSGGGLAVLKQGWSDPVDGRDVSRYVAVAGPGPGRRQDDHLSLIWYERGRWLLVDAGHADPREEPDDVDPGDGDEPGAGVPLPSAEELAAYLVSSEAHNTVSIKKARRGPATGGFVRWGEVHGMPFVDAEAVRAGANHRRSVVAGEAWLAVLDRLSVGWSRSARIWFHSPSPLEMVPRPDRYVLVEDGAPVVWVQRIGSPARMIEPLRGARRPSVQGWRISPSGRPLTSWAYGWRCRLPLEGVTVFTTRGPATVLDSAPGVFSWESAGRRVQIAVDALGVADVVEEAT